MVFVPFALPGETVRARIYRNDKNCSHADLVEVLVPSPDRVVPRCPLFGECGGCQYQHLAYQKQLEWKTRQVGELMKHMAGVVFPVNPCLSARADLALPVEDHAAFRKAARRRCWARSGFWPPAGGRSLVDVPECAIAMDAINAALPGIRDGLRAQAHTFKRGSTVLLRATGDGVETDFKATASERVGDLTFQFLAGDFFQNNPFILPAFTGYVARPGGRRRHAVSGRCLLRRPGCSR